MTEFIELKTNSKENQLFIGDLSISFTDIKLGNPYNTSAIIKVISGEFSGVCEFEFDLKSLKIFLAELEKAYAKINGNAVLSDISYGSFVRFKMCSNGSVDVNGTLLETTEQSLKFSFKTDQMVIGNFINDFVKYLSIVIERGS